MDSLDRKKLTTLALNALSKLKHARTYALTTDEAKVGLACLAAALKADREARNLADNDEPTLQNQLIGLFERLSQAGVNLQQIRPEGEEKKLPQRWTNPITGERLPPPVSVDERSILERHDPELLRWFDAMAKHPYKTVIEHRDAEKKRRVLAEAPYGETEHLANPWRRGDRKMQDGFVRRSPAELVQFYQREARNIEVPIFGKDRNLTIEGRLAKDPETFALMKTAQRIHSDWQAQDRAALQEQRAKAELALKKLESVA